MRVFKLQGCMYTYSMQIFKAKLGKIYRRGRDDMMCTKSRVTDNLNLILFRSHQNSTTDDPEIGGGKFGKNSFLPIVDRCNIVSKPRKRKRSGQAKFSFTVKLRRT